MATLTAAPAQRSLLRPILLLTLTTMFWAGHMVLGRALVLEDTPPFTLALGRWVVALLVLVPFGFPAMWRQRHLLLPHWRLLTMLALLSVAAYSMLNFLALKYTTAVNGGLVNATLPATVAALVWAFGIGRVLPRQIAGMVVSFVGVTVVLVRGDPEVLLGLGFNAGDLIMYGAVISWAFYTIGLARLPASISPVALLSALAIIGTTAMLPFAGWEYAHGQRMVLDREMGLSLLYLGTFPTVGAYLFWNTAVAQAGPRLPAYFTNVTPIFISILAVFLLGETVHLYHAAGFLMVATGIILANSRRG